MDHRAQAFLDDVRLGLTAEPKKLPSHLLYDAHGSELFDQITATPEYYVARCEQEILRTAGDAIVRHALRHSEAPLSVLELGAGTATKSQTLLRALVEHQGRSLYLPTDLSRSALEQATLRLRREEPLVELRPLVATHERALAFASELAGPVFVWFFGSSLGNYDCEEASALLASIRAVIGNDGLLLLGMDRPKPVKELLQAYDDAQGITAAFNKNLLVRINRELGGQFNIASFSHVAVWNEADSRIEMHLESKLDQTVWIEELERCIDFGASERIHTESSYKYDEARVDALLRQNGLTRQHTFSDAGARCSAYLVRAS